jgi:hypothetical protein
VGGKVTWLFANSPKAIAKVVMLVDTVDPVVDLANREEKCASRVVSIKVIEAAVKDWLKACIGPVVNYHVIRVDKAD